MADPTTFTNQTPVVTGPYTLGTFNPNEYTLVKNDKYWQADKVAIDKLIFPGSNSQLDIVDNGYDWAYSFLTDVQDTWVKQNGGKNVYWYPPGGTIALFPNLTKAPFNNLNFREALSYSLNRKQIADTAEQGYVQPAGQSGTAPAQSAEVARPVAAERREHLPGHRKSLGLLPEGGLSPERREDG